MVSHDKTFEIFTDGVVRVVGTSMLLMQHQVQKGDIFRMCQVKEEPIQNWIALAIGRARTTKTPAIFWLDENRAHDAQLIRKVNISLPKCDTDELSIMSTSPVEAMRYSLECVKMGKNTISVTGNVLRDY